MRNMILVCNSGAGRVFLYHKNFKKGGIRMSNKIHQMAQSMKVGKKGEDIIYDILTKKPYVTEVVDLRDDKSAREDDVDFIAKFCDGSQHGVEVKTDTQHYTGNMFIEELSSNEYGTPGCMMKTKAEFVIYYYIGIGLAYIINIAKFRAWYEANKMRFVQKNNIKNLHGNRITNSTGRLVPRSLLESEGKDFVKVWDLEIMKKAV